MEKPKVFANKVDKDFQNNNKMYYSKEIRLDRGENNLSVEEKINKIFSSSRYVYKADVAIKYKDGRVVRKVVVGRNKDGLITFDNEVIKKSDIVDIDYAK